jgi:ribonucleoside-diphosphate reductase alpha chain
MTHSLHRALIIQEHGTEINLDGKNNMSTIYDKLDLERHALQKEGKLPLWFKTAGWQLFKEKVATEEYPDFLSVTKRVADAAAKFTDEPSFYSEKFFEIIWNGWLGMSTPVMCNMGVPSGKAQAVSCSGGTVKDSVAAFYDSLKECALLSQQAYGTSYYLGEIRPRGAAISGVKGTASGPLNVFEDIIKVAQHITQGYQRRGAVASYIEIDHPDAREILTFCKNNPEDANLGWCISDAFIDKLKAGDKEANEMLKDVIMLRMFPGIGYMMFPDKINRKPVAAYERRGIKVRASNLCTEIALFSGTDHTTGKEYTFSCVLSSMNAATFDEWKDTNAVFFATVFLDCINQSQIEGLKGKPTFEKIVNFAEDTRALGLGLMGFHTYLQANNMEYAELQSQFKLREILGHMNSESLRASQWMAKNWGEPEWCKGLGLRNTHRMCIAPNLSSSLILGGVSQGIGPIYKNAYVQLTPVGKVERASPALMKIMKERGIDFEKASERIVNNGGSVQYEDYLTDKEKQVFLTAFEINQFDILRMASIAQRDLDQMQSINLYFAAEEDEEYIRDVHQAAIEDEYIHSLYYVRGTKGVSTHKECTSCHG